MGIQYLTAPMFLQTNQVYFRNGLPQLRFPSDLFTLDVNRGELMDTISRYEFMGSWLYFWLLCISGIGIPIAILYLLNGTLRIEEQVKDAERVVQSLRAKR